ncbi:hypothetical protein P9112_005580 [Eukaryota sp. TZLM1-RC]
MSTRTGWEATSTPGPSNVDPVPSSMAYIPSLDGGEDLTSQISKPAPELPQVQTSEALDELASYSLPPIPYKDIPTASVAFLTNVVDPALEVFEDDDPWTNESLLQDVADFFEAKT